jgi:hypothetical protein
VAAVAGTFARGKRSELSDANAHVSHARARLLRRMRSPGEGDDGKVDASFHSPAYIAAHIASLQARCGQFLRRGRVCARARVCVW